MAWARIPTDLVQEVISEGADGTFVPSNDKERERIAKGQVFFDGKWMSKTKRDKQVDKLLEEQKQRVEELKSSRLWRNRISRKTKNFTFESTLPEHLLERYMELSENYFASFVKTWKIRKPKGMALNVKFYVDPDSFYQVTGVGRGTLAFFINIEPYELHVYYDRLDVAGTEDDLFHEMGHYLQKLVDVDFRYPHWPGEALSEYYGISSDLWLRSPEIDLTTATSAILVFHQWVDMDNFDHGDTGTVRVLDAAGLPGSVTELAVIRINIQGLDPAGWVKFSKNLPSAVLGKTVALEFRFTSDFVPDADASGWYIDDILITAEKP